MLAAIANNCQCLAATHTTSYTSKWLATQIEYQTHCLEKYYDYKTIMSAAQVNLLFY